MNKIFATGLLVLSSSISMANDCVVELQFEGAALGLNRVSASSCISATRACKRSEKEYSLKYGISTDELSCVKTDSLTSVPTAIATNDCLIELQFEGAILGQNSFLNSSCIEATKACKRAEKSYTMSYGFSSDDLTCVKIDTVANIPDAEINQTNGGYVGSNNTHVNDGYNNTNHNTGYYGNYDPSYTRAQAMYDLESIEGNTSEASVAFNLISEYSAQFKIGLRAGVDLYRAITNIHGRGYTDTNLSIFEIMVNGANANNAVISEVVAAYKVMYDAERNMNHAITNLEHVIALSLANNKELSETLTSFTVLLKIIGTGYSERTRTIFSKLVEIRRVLLPTAITDFQTMINLENKIDDAVGNYDLVILAASSPSIRYRDALQTMTDLLKRYGSGSTPTVRSKFAQIYNL